jgi:4-hydroxy-3-methylbut-2-enyl diphosphate reductase
MVNDLEPYKGQTLEIMITQYDPDKKRLRVSGSRRALLSALRREKAEEVWASIEVGKEYNGIVRSLTDFGAFVDIGGVDGLVHVSELSWNRIRHPSEVVNVGDEINVFVKDFDSEKKRISLGYKRPEDDPYHDVESRFPVGSIVRGIVVRMFPFGAFVEIAPGVDALCHISQISDVRLVKPNDVLAEGMEIDARVLEVSNENRRISISIKEVEPINPVTEMDENAQSSEEANETYVSEQDQFNAPSGELEIPQQEEEIPQQEEEEPEA